MFIFHAVHQNKIKMVAVLTILEQQIMIIIVVIILDLQIWDHHQ